MLSVLKAHLSDKRRAVFTLGSLILITHLVLSYYGQWRYHYIAPPGDDVYNHLRLATDISHNPAFWPSAYYPPGLHYLVIGLSSITGLSFVTVFIWLTPALLIISGLAIWFLASQLFGRKIGLICYGLYALLSLQPLQTANDGTVANLLASNILLPIALVFWYRVWTANVRDTWKWLVAFLVSAALVVYTHHLSTLVFVIVIVVSAFFLGLARLRDRAKTPMWFAIFGLGFAAALAIGFYIFKYWVFFSPERHLIEAARQLASEQKHWPLSAYVTAINPVIALFGFLGAVLGLKNLWQGSSWLRQAALAIILSWLAIYFFGSISSAVGEPERLGRDWAMPGVIIAGYGLVAIWQYLSDQLLRKVFMVVLAVALVTGFLVKLDKQTSYNLMVRFTPADQMLLDDINARRFAAPLPIVTHPLTKFAWEYMAHQEILDGKIIFENAPEAAAMLTATPGACVASGYSKVPVWPDDIQDMSSVQELFRVDGVKAAVVMEDKVKVWYILCKH